jgi:hypothetical protein
VLGLRLGLGFPRTNLEDGGGSARLLLAICSSSSPNIYQVSSFAEDPLVQNAHKLHTPKQNLHFEARDQQ